MIIFVILCVLLAVICIVWLYQRAQGREKGKPDEKLTDALQKLKEQGKCTMLQHQKKDDQDGK